MQNKTPNLVGKYNGNNPIIINSGPDCNIAECISWDDIELNFRCHTEQYKNAIHFIRFSLGYLPEAQIYTPHLAFVQILTENVLRNTIDVGCFTDEMVFHAKRIRNDDMKKSGWMKRRKYSEDEMNVYETFLLAHKETARKRLSTLIGYAPEIEHSLEAEILLRQEIEANPKLFEGGYKEIDHQAVSITIYRETFLLFGEEVADNSDLMGLLYNQIGRELKENV